MGWFGNKPKQTEFDTSQDKQIEQVWKSIDSIIKWTNSVNKHIQTLYQEIASLKAYDQKHDALFKSMRETDQKMQGFLDALGKVSEAGKE